MPNVPLSETERTRLGTLVAGYARAGIETQGRAPRWWAECQRIHDNQGSADGDFSETSPDDSGLPAFHVPFSQPRQDALKDQVCEVVTNQRPYVLCETDEDGMADDKAEFVHRVWQAGGFEEAFEIAVSIATDTDLAYLRMCPLPEGGVEWVALDPSDVAIFPALPSGMDEAQFVGHRVHKTARSIKEGRDKPQNDPGAYYDGREPVGASEGDDDSSGTVLRSGADLDVAGPEGDLDRRVEIWDCVVRLDVEGKPKQALYRATLELGGSELLALEPYPFSERWYFEVRLLGRSKSYYPSRSVGRNLYTSQDAYNRLWSMLYNVGMMAAMPPIFLPYKLVNGDKYTQYGAGDVIEGEGQGQPWSPATGAQLGPIPLAIQALDAKGDQIAKISQNTTGGNVQAQTATEASVIASGVAVGIGGYIRNAAKDLPRAATLTCEYGAMYFPKFARRFGLVADEEPLGMPMPNDPNAPPEPDPGMAALMGG